MVWVFWYAFLMLDITFVDSEKELETLKKKPFLKESLIMIKLILLCGFLYSVKYAALDLSRSSMWMILAVVFFFLLVFLSR